MSTRTAATAPSDADPRADEVEHQRDDEPEADEPAPEQRSPVTARERAWPRAPRRPSSATSSDELDHHRVAIRVLELAPALARRLPGEEHDQRDGGDAGRRARGQEQRAHQPARRSRSGMAELLEQHAGVAGQEEAEEHPDQPDLRPQIWPVDSDGDRLSTDDTKVNRPKTPTAQAPIDIGSQNLKVRIMFMNRVGTPRSAMSKSPHGRHQRQREQVAHARHVAVARAAEVVGDGGGEVRAPGDAAEEEVPDDHHLPVGRLKHRGPPLLAVAERQEHAEADSQGRADGEQRVDDDVALRQLRIVRQVVDRRLGQQQEERVEAAQEAAGVGTVQLGVLEAHLLERLHPLLRLAHQLVAEAELDGLGRARLGAGRAQAVVDAVVAERALRWRSRSSR